MKQIGEGKTVSPALTETQKDAVMCAEGQKVRAYTKVDMLSPLKNIIVKAYATLGQGGNVSAAEITTLNEQFMLEAKTSLQFLTLEEIAMAIDYGVKGKLNDLTKISKPEMSVTNLTTWCWIFVNNIRKNALHEQRHFEEKEEKKYNAEREAAAAKQFEKDLNALYRNYYNDPSSIEEISVGLRAVYYEAIDKRIRLQTGGKIEAGKAVGGTAIVSPQQKKQIKEAAEIKFPSYDRLGILEQKKLEDPVQRQRFEQIREYEIKLNCYSESLHPMLESLKYVIGDDDIIIID